jgi:hypothetical protein
MLILKFLGCNEEMLFKEGASIIENSVFRGDVDTIDNESFWKWWLEGVMGEGEI